MKKKNDVIGENGALIGSACLDITHICFKLYISSTPFVSSGEGIVYVLGNAVCISHFGGVTSTFVRSGRHVISWDIFRSVHTWC